MTSPPKRTRLTPEARRQQLLDVTERLILEQGASALTLEEIAAEAGVTVQLLYHYFDGRDALIGATLEAVFVRFDTEVGARIAGADTFEAKLRVLCQQVIDPLPSIRVLGAVSGVTAEAADVAQSLEQHAVRVGLFIASLIQDEHGTDHGVAVMAAAAILGAAQAFTATRRVLDWDQHEAEDFLVAICLGIAQTAADRYGA